MTSATDAMLGANTENQTDTWKPSDVHRLVPTLVITCGIREALSLRANVEERLDAELLRVEAVRWGELDPDKVLESGVDDSPERMDQVVERLLTPIVGRFFDLEYVEKLAAAGLLSRAGEEELFSLQIIVVYDLDRRGDAVASRVLPAVEAALERLIPRGRKVSLILVVLGDGRPNLGQKTAYWPKFRLHSKSYSGLEVTRARVVEACQNLLVALITSELASAIDHRVGDARQSVGWIWAGASAVVADLSGMREFVRCKIFQLLVAPMLKAELTADVRHRVDRDVRKDVLALQISNLDRALEIPSHEESRYRWEAERKKNTVEVVRMDLKAHGEIFPPAGHLAADLSQWYGTLRRSLIEHGGGRAREEFGKLCERFAFRIDPPPDDDDALKSTGKTTGGEAPSTLGSQLLPGLAAATFAVEKSAEYLTKWTDLIYTGRVPRPVGGASYLSSVAHLDAGEIEGEYRRYRRYERTILSPQGYLLRLFPAWPILAAVLVALSDWDILRAGVVAALLLAIYSVIQHIVLKRSLSNLEQRVKASIHRILRYSTLETIGNVLRGYRLLLAGRLCEIAFNFRNLLTLLAREHARSLRRLADSRARVDVPQKGVTSVYWLADWDIWDVYGKKKAKELAKAPRGDFYSSIAEIIFRSFVGEKGQLAKSGASMQSYRPAFREIGQWVEQLTTDVFVPAELKAHALAAKEDVLKNGRIWKWLYDKAEPLGGGASLALFTIYAGENPAAYETTTAALKPGSPYWVDGLQIAMSRQMHEITCIRGVIEAAGEGHGLD